MTRTPQPILDELKRLEKLSRQTMSPTERKAYEVAEDKVSRRLALFSATVARQQRAEGELVIKGNHEGYHRLRAMHEFANAHAHF